MTCARLFFSWPWLEIWYPLGTGQSPHDHRSGFHVSPSRAAPPSSSTSPIAHAKGSDCSGAPTAECLQLWESRGEQGLTQCCWDNELGLFGIEACTGQIWVKESAFKFGTDYELCITVTDDGEPIEDDHAAGESSMD